MKAVRLGWPRRAIRRNLIALTIAVSIGVLACVLQVQESQALYPSGPLHAMESAAQDTVLRTRNPDRYGSSIGRDARSLVTLVAIDERSLAQLGVFRNWPRAYYAQVIDNLMAAPPRVIVLDIGFFEPTTDDFVLAAAVDRAQQRRPPTAVVLAAIGGGSAVRGPDGAVSFVNGVEPVFSLGGPPAPTARCVTPATGASIDCGRGRDCVQRRIVQRAPTESSQKQR